ncbi:BREX-1 system adenine-specific DNA-methyltransferase PglX [Enterococcus lemanii]|uniref:site-specific DNA-methyltransferase (adenine-specific) n=1 Tax=Enterococcus lemanii TaxID=1159752 RepID=A0ABV9MT24_9ENTE|nr:BREX-1 system adenine-specific DNA-methyltransferase PglX [Enterococcus lemanii]MBM7709401.1 hypothetical protein [Enterococcus lemanii]
MDKKAIRNFAINARNILIARVGAKLAKLGVTESGIDEIIQIDSSLIEIKGNRERFSGKDIVKRAKLVEELQKREANSDSKIAYNTLVEEVAYTWFNRLIAIRFMEVNNYLPDRQRVLSSESIGKKEPDIITNLLETNLYQEFDEPTKKIIVDLISDGSAQAVDELYQLVFIRVCNNLNQQLPNLFEKIDDYTELLFSISYIDDNGVIASLLTIPEEDFDVSLGGQIEIIGWMYQYYNTEPKDKVFARGNRKIRADEIPAATQLFTPDWIVRYMVENSLGRYYIDQKLANRFETRTEKEIADEFGWKYYLPSAEQPEEVQLQILDERKNKSDFALQELKLIDPSMGSGHILVYAFEVFLQLYEAEGESTRTAVEIILERNLFGLDIDKRAFQLAYFALMMKGRQYNRHFLMKNLQPNVYQIPDNFGISESELQLVHFNFPNQEKGQVDLTLILNAFKMSPDLGSLISFEGIDFKNLKSGISKETVSFFDEELKQIIQVAELLQMEYTIAITNPPYMGAAGMNKELAAFVKKEYPASKSDLFAIFMERLKTLLDPLGYYAMITQHAWMFLSSFEKLRLKINQQTIINMIHLGTRAFEEIGGEVVQTTAFVMSPIKHLNYTGSYLRLVDFPNHEEKEKKAYKAIQSGKSDYLFSTLQDNFTKIPGMPISYWVSENFINSFENSLLGDIIVTREGMATADNDRFLRFWQEIEFNKIGFSQSNYLSGYKWFPYNKGGKYRKWDTRQDFVVNWENNGFDIKNNKDPKTGRIRSHNYNGEYALKAGLTWSSLTSGNFSARYSPGGYMFDSKGAMGFKKDNSDIYIILGLLNSTVASAYLKFFSPTLDYKVGDIILIPDLDTDKLSEKVIPIVQSCIKDVNLYSQSFENYWEFKNHPLT